MPQVAIIGAGIGGLTLYHALQQHGIDADLYEAAPALQAVGAGIALSTNAMQVLARLGVAGAVVEHGWCLRRFQFRDIRGEVLQDFDLAPYEVQYGYGSVGIHRAALQRLLALGISPTRLHLGKSCTRVSPDEDHAEVTFSDGTTHRADVVVVADGIRSVGRQQLFPAQRLRYAGEAVYRGVASMDLPSNLMHTSWEIWGCGERFGFVGIAERQVYWYAGIVAPPGQAHAPATIARDLHARAAAFPDPVPQLVATTAPDAIIQNDVYDLSPSLKAWHHGHAVLLGDAAHAMTPNLGQGAAQAIEDAYVLANALRHQPSPEAAFQTFQKTRRTRVDKIVKNSWWLGKIAQVQSPIAQQVRNFLLKSVPNSVTRWNINRLFRLGF